MIVSLVFENTYKLRINANRMIKVDDHNLNVDKDIPIVRYRFAEYTDKEVEYITAMMSELGRATHLAEIVLNEHTVENIEKLPTMAKFVYSEITEEEVQNASLSSEKLELFRGLKAISGKIDRIMLKDKSKTLDTVTYSKISGAIVRILGISPDSVGICSSPLSFDENCCLSAVRAREIMTKYSSVADVALPSANHQCMNCCGCIRYLVVPSDTEMVSVGSKKKKGTTEKSTEDTKDKPKSSNSKSKGQIKPGMFRL